MGLILATRADVPWLVSFLLILIVASPLAAQRRVELILDGQGVRRTGTTTVEPNQVSYVPRFADGGGAALGVAWFATDRVAVELKAAALASHLTIRRTGSDFITIGELGWAQIYPLSLLVQWHPIAGGSFRPYVGAGVGYVILPDVDKSAGGVTGVAFDDPTGLVVNAGLRIPFSSRWSLNGDVRYVPVETRGQARFGGTSASAHVEVRPLLVGVGLAYRF